VGDYQRQIQEKNKEIEVIVRYLCEDVHRLVKMCHFRRKLERLSDIPSCVLTKVSFDLQILLKITHI
jgi:hypothetical protein